MEKQTGAQLSKKLQLEDKHVDNEELNLFNKFDI